MASNLYSGSHKYSSEKYRENYEKIRWGNESHIVDKACDALIRAAEHIADKVVDN